MQWTWELIPCAKAYIVLSMEKRIFAIGDIHGELNALETLIDSLELTEKDELVFLGDYVDKGPQSKEVLDYLIDLQEKYDCTFVRGNHEEFMLYVIDEEDFVELFWGNHGGNQTLKSYGAEDCDELRKVLPEAHKTFLRNTVDAHETDTHVFAHAGWHPERKLEEQSVKTLRYRFLSATKSELEFDKKVICGHSAIQSGHPAVKDHITCVDTIENGWLTAYDLTNEKFYQASPDGQTREIDKAETFNEKCHVPEVGWRENIEKLEQQRKKRHNGPK